MEMPMERHEPHDACTMNSARCLLRFQSVGFLAPSLPGDPVDLARLSLHRIANDLGAKVTVCQMPCTDISESGEEITFPHYLAQMELLAKHNPNRPVFVEGPFPQWLRKTYSGLINCPLRKRASFAMCMTSRGDQATLNQWISGLQETNPTQFRLEADPRERHILSLDTGTDRGEMKKQGPGQRDRQSQILLWRRDIAVARE
ncbi:unnamed protein product [Coregonus sp. 'balchen']|nr:unnamed protein product [Coregonus sp. 'balchen']